MIKGVIILDWDDGVCCDRWDCKGEVWDLFVRLEWFWGSVVGGFWGTFGVWFYCVCWDEVDNALRKRRGLPKNVNRGDVYK